MTKTIFPSAASRTSRRANIRELWQKFFKDPSQWWDNRFNKSNPKLPDFVHKTSHEALWFDPWLDPPRPEVETTYGSDMNLLDPNTAIKTLWLFDIDAKHHSLGPSNISVAEDYSSFSVFRSLRQLCEDDRLDDAVHAVELLYREAGFRISATVFFRLLQECIDKGNLATGRNLHGLIIKCGFESDTFLANHLIRMFALFGSLLEADEVFKKVVKPDVFVWGAIISAHCKLGHNNQAIELYHQMQRSSVQPDGHVFVAVLKACTNLADIEPGLLIHWHVIENGFESSTIVVANALIDLYTKCVSIPDAQNVFDKSVDRDVVTWSTLIAGYAQDGHEETAIKLFHQMQEVGIEPNIITWNALLGIYSHQGQFQEAFHFLQQMCQDGIQPDSVTFVCMLKACFNANHVRKIHRQAVEVGLEFDVVVGNALIDRYTKCGSLLDAATVFDLLKDHNRITWNSIITGYAHCGCIHEALHFFEHMQHEVTKPDNVSWNALIAALASIGESNEAFKLYQQMVQVGMDLDNVTFINILKACVTADNIKLIHAEVFAWGFHLDAMVGNTLIDLYAKSGCLPDARKVFDMLSDDNVGTWNTMISGYAQHGIGDCALDLFGKMQQQGVVPDNITLVSVLKACTSIVALDQGKLIHEYIIKSACQQADNFVWGSMVDMYVKCGSLDDAQSVFWQLPSRDIALWNTIIAGYAQNSESYLALQTLETMQNEGLKPDSVSYISLLSACSHTGLIDEGRTQFKLMREKYGIFPSIDHYNCMVDIFGRAGCLKEAEGLLHSAPFQENVAGWTSLLGHCRMHGNVELGQKCFDYLACVNCSYAAAYILMSDMYSHSGMLKEVTSLCELRKCADAWKKVGTAILQFDGMVEEFKVGENAPLYDAKIRGLSSALKKEGYTPLLELVLPRSDDVWKDTESEGDLQNYNVPNWQEKQQMGGYLLEQSG